MTRTLVFSNASRQDLKQIYRYGATNWGTRKADDYWSNLESRLWLLTEQPEMRASCPELGKGLYRLVAKPYNVYYCIHSHQIQIVRILHGRQDPTIQQF